MKRTLTIGAVASQTGVSADTIRFYEKKGLLPRPPRNQSGYRIYSPELVDRIRFLRRARELDFSLRDVENLLTIERDGPPSNGCDIKTGIEKRLVDIKGAMDDLQGQKLRLEQLLDLCDRRSPCQQCHVFSVIRA